MTVRSDVLVEAYILPKTPSKCFKLSERDQQNYVISINRDIHSLECVGVEIFVAFMA